MNIGSIQGYLKQAPENFKERISQTMEELLAKAKREAVAASNQKLAKEIWCLEQTLEIQDNFIKAFFQMKSEKFYDAWCTLEKVEIGINSLHKHFQDSWGYYHLSFIEKYVTLYQSIFPYKVFISPEMLKLEEKCSICDTPISIRNPCGHRIGEIYDGEMCLRIVTKVEFLGASIVKNPVQKCSVVFLSDSESGKQKDHYDYSVVKYLIQRLDSPFHGWDVNWTKKRHPHSKFSDIRANDLCPCKSGKKYEDCCLPESGVLQNHVEFIFHVLPPEHLLTTVYNY